MKVKYFPDTDTLLVSLSDKKIVETRDLNENVLIELDGKGRVVSLTIEHAKQQANLPFLSYEQIEESPDKSSTSRSSRR